jgi:hypothetical protein
MNKLAIIAPLALLAACEARDDATAPEAAATEAAATTAAAPAAGPTPGSYDVTGPDGTKTVDTLMADGTYVSRDAQDKVIEKGTWAFKDGKTCFDAEGDTAEVCYTESARNPDGSFDATGPDGKVAKIMPRAS